MDIVNCSRCGKMFNSVMGKKICPTCIKREEENFKIVRKFVREHPEATIPEIASENDVSIKQIHQWIREERLLFSKDSEVGIDCERCGTTIRTGRFCEKCKAEIKNDVENIQRSNEPKEEPKAARDTKAKMRYMNKK